MAGTKSDYLVHMELDASMGDGTYTEPASVYLALCKSAVAAGDNASALSEPTTWTNYARELIPPASFGAAASRQKLNTAIIDFGTATSTLDEDLTHWAIVDSASGAGNVLWFGTLGTSFTVSNGTPVSVGVNGIELEVSATPGTPA